MGEPSGKRSLHLRLDAKLHDELQQLAGEAGRGIADLVRELLEYAMLTHGNSREVAYKFHADCQDASSKGFERFEATVEQDIATIDAGAPAPLQPPPTPDLAFAQPSELSDDTAEADEEKPESDFPAAPIAGAATRHPTGNGAAANTAVEGA